MRGIKRHDNSACETSPDSGSTITACATGACDAVCPVVRRCAPHPMRNAHWGDIAAGDGELGSESLVSDGAFAADAPPYSIPRCVAITTRCCSLVGTVPFLIFPPRCVNPQARRVLGRTMRAPLFFDREPSSTMSSAPRNVRRDPTRYEYCLGCEKTNSSEAPCSQDLADCRLPRDRCASSTPLILPRFG